MKTATSHPDATLEFMFRDGELQFTITGRLDVAAVSTLWKKAAEPLGKETYQTVRINGAGIDWCDGAGASFLAYLQHEAERRDAVCGFDQLPDKVAQILSLHTMDAQVPEESGAKSTRWKAFVMELGEATAKTGRGLAEHIAFLGELSAGILRLIRRPAGLRFGDFFRVCEQAGIQALPIIGMLGFLIGLILAFQGAVLMAQFGAEIYIADFVGKSVARELGPLITAIIVAGRTGSAFAAELGTMKVNEEIDALNTMGLQPVRFLVMPRVLGAVCMTPLLAVLTNLFALAGGAVVMRGIGFPLVTYTNRVLAAVTTADYGGGLLKALVFGFLISASGCLCGLRAGEGASAVGDAATRAVVSSIIMIVLADGLFAVLFFFLGL